jgi:carboxyl-terminal processing protease
VRGVCGKLAAAVSDSATDKDALTHAMDSNMRRRVLSNVSAVCLATAVLFALVGIATAQQSTFVSPRAAEVGEILHQGRLLEVEDRWGEALTHYEKAIREFPEEPSLQRQFNFTRSHYDLRRRYGDPSFQNALRRSSRETALDLYAEVIAKIQSHYVEAPQCKELVERGANGLDVALTEPPFLAANVAEDKRAEVDSFRQALRRELGDRVILNHNDARAAVARAAELGQQLLGLSPVAVVMEFTCGATNSLDPYSAYLTPGQLSEVYSQIEGNFVGLGVELKANADQLVIDRVIPASPAERAGLRNGDRILAVDGKWVRDMSADRAANLLQGEEGTLVQLAVAGPGQQTRQLTVRRQRVDVPSVDSVRIVDGRLGIGYLRLTCFQKTTDRDLDDALWKLHRAGMRNWLIMDLRHNPGGLLTTAVETVDKFVQQGTIVTTKGRNVQEGFTYSAHAAGTWGVPLIVLIDQDSASAAEIFAGAIRDHRRGTIIGARSYGKGSVQGIFPLQSGESGMRLTTAKFYSPKGLPYSMVGVQPDIQVQQTAKPIDGALTSGNDDAVLTEALQFARRSVTRQPSGGLAGAQR